MAGTAATTPLPAPLTVSAADPAGKTFCTVAVAVAATRVQLAVPQPYPLGQHPGTGPALEGQRNQPAAHVEADGPAPPAPEGTGTTTVSPPDTTVVEAGGGGQLVVAQSRPVWQQPPPAEARQA